MAVTTSTRWVHSLEKRKGLTVDDPALDLGHGHLQRSCYLRVGQVLPDILEAEVGEREQADFALQLRTIQPCAPR